MNNNQIKVTECIREFKLRQQYPSMITKPKATGKMVVLNTSLQSLKPVTTNFTSKTNTTQKQQSQIQTQNELHKIKLKLPNGKYLGEFNMQVLSNNKDNTLKNKTISIINENKDKKFYKAIILPKAVLENKKVKVITTKHLQSMKSADQENLSSKSLYLNETSKQITNNNVGVKHDNVSQQSKDIALKNLKQVISSNQHHEESNYTDVENMDIDSESNNCEGSEYSKVQRKRIASTNKLNNIINILSNQNPKNQGLENGISPLNNSTVLEHKIINTAINDKDLNTPYANENRSIEERISNHNICEEIYFQNENPNIKLLETNNCDNINHNISSDKSNHTETQCNITEKVGDYSLLELENSLNVHTIASSNANIMPKKPYFSKTTENLNTNSLISIPFYDNYTFSPFDPLQDECSEKLINYNLIDDLCNTHSTAIKVKEVLSESNILCNKISEQLKQDIKNVRKWDENGMLNIHKAVINNRINDVQRYLMVLKACNVNMEIPTQSGMTSLELAIKHNTCAEIVKLLLEAGANPVSFQVIHDSALILASKENSPLLSELIKYAPSSKQLDYFDFTGFAAIHYCAQYGNLEGINLLINKGANINLQESRSGRTALFLALENNYVEVAQQLIENGAQKDIPNFSGHTVMSLLEKHNILL